MSSSQGNIDFDNQLLYFFRTDDAINYVFKNNVLACVAILLKTIKYV